jgi:hypothetical protein
MNPYPFTVILCDDGYQIFSCCTRSVPYHNQDCPNDPDDE